MLVQQEFDYQNLPNGDREFIQDRSGRIRELVKLTAQGILKIGGYLTDVKERLAHGKWLPWLEHEFGWSDDTALNFMRVAERFKARNFRDLQIDASALYLMAATKTADAVREDLLAQAEGGLRITRQVVQEAVEKHTPPPPPAEARRLATQLGMAVADNTGVYQTPNSTPELEAARMERNAAVGAIERSVLAVAGSTLDPAGLAHSLENWECRNWDGDVPAAITWLVRLKEALELSGKV
jgi:hypothetical protein